MCLQTLKGKSKSSHDLLKDDPRLSSVPAVNKYVLNTLAYMQCCCHILTKSFWFNRKKKGKKSGDAAGVWRAKSGHFHFHYLCSIFGSNHKLEHVLNRQMTSLMVMLKRVMQMKSMTPRAGRGWESLLAKNYRKKQQRNQQNAVRRIERRRSAAGTSGFLHRNVNSFVQMEVFISSFKSWNSWVVFSQL